MILAISELIVVYSDDPECSNKDFKCDFKNSMEVIMDFSIALFVFTMAVQIKLTLESWKSERGSDSQKRGDTLILSGTSTGDSIFKQSSV